MKQEFKYGHKRGPQRHVRRQRSDSQRKRNNAFKTCSIFWKKHFSSDFHDAWQSFAFNKETAYMAFMRINIYRVFNDLSILSVPPGLV